MSFTTASNLHAQVSPRAGTFQYGRGPDFQIERSPRPGHTRPLSGSRQPSPQPTPDLDTERALQGNVDVLLRATARPFAITGSVPFDEAGALTLFFRSKGSTTHSIDLPFDVDYDMSPVFNTLLSACKPHSVPGDHTDYGALAYPPNLPLSLNFDLAGHPILDAVRTALLPELPTGHYLSTVRERLEVLNTSASLGPQPAYLRNDGRLATVVLILPVRFRGGTLVVRNTTGSEERFVGKTDKGAPRLDWVAFLADCDYEVDPVQNGCRLAMTYAVYPRSFGPSGFTDPLLAPGDDLLDTIAPILNLCRSRKIAFYLAQDYGLNPSENLAEALVPQLKGGDSVLYHALKLYKLEPELHWTAGGYIWPSDRVVECGSDPVDARRLPVPPVRGTFSTYPNLNDAEMENLKWRVEGSGAIPLAGSGIHVLRDWEGVMPMGKERVPFISSGELEKLIVNVLIVTYVP